MIPIELRPEPSDFDSKVRQPGRLFLNRIPSPNDSEWRGKDYWQKALPEMRDAYEQICAYCAQWIPHGTGRHSVDHYLPKRLYPDKAYEWANFRYVSARFNSRKGVQEILDPFQIGKNWFVIDFSSFFIRPNSGLPSEIIDLIEKTIKVLKLNDDEALIEERLTYVRDYCHGEITFRHLQKHAPFIAYELQRQGLIDDISIQLTSIC